jgi:hypothetical protein
VTNSEVASLYVNILEILQRIIVPMSDRTVFLAAAILLPLAFAASFLVGSISARPPSRARRCIEAALWTGGGALLFLCMISLVRQNEVNRAHDLAEILTRDDFSVAEGADGLDRYAYYLSVPAGPKKYLLLGKPVTTNLWPLRRGVTRAEMDFIVKEIGPLLEKRSVATAEKLGAQWFSRVATN